MDRDTISTLHAIHEHGITGEDQDGISAWLDLKMAPETPRRPFMEPT